MALTKLVFFGILAVVSAFPSQPDPLFSKWSSEDLRFSHREDDHGDVHLVDNWVKMSDLERMARYNPESSNHYHLFTRLNPTVSQVLLLNNANSIHMSNFDGNKRTVITMHGFLGYASSTVNTVIVPAYLEAEDLNVIVLDWGAGSNWGPNAGAAGTAAGQFINWLISVSGGRADRVICVGFSVGGHGAASIARAINGQVQSVIGLDPADRWDDSTAFRPDDGEYTEVIHTSSIGDQDALAQADFFPNGGRNQPGCLGSICHHSRSFYFLAESLQTGGFTGRRCNTVAEAHAGNCSGSTLQMGGLNNKNGNGIYHLTTNRGPPFSQG